MSLGLEEARRLTSGGVELTAHFIHVASVHTPLPWIPQIPTCLSRAGSAVTDSICSDASMLGSSTDASAVLFSFHFAEGTLPNALESQEWLVPPQERKRNKAAKALSSPCRMEGMRRCYAQGCVLCAALREREAAKVRTKASLPPSARGVLSKNAAPQQTTADHARRSTQANPQRQSTQANPQRQAAPATAKPKRQPNPADAEQQQLQRALARSRQTAAEEAASAVGGSLSAAERQYRSLILQLQQREITPEDYDMLLRLDEAIPKKNVLSDDALALVLDVVESPDVGADGECAICVGELDQGEPAARLCCGHVYHLTCIRQWLTTGRDTCPMCGTQQCVAHGGGP